MRTRITITVIGILAAMALVAVPAASAATDIHRATLKGSNAYPAANGKAKFSRDDGVRQLEAELQDVKALAGTNVKFVVNGNVVGTAKVNSLGTARIDKAGGAVPNVSAGSMIRVRRLNGVLVASGRFS
ncbi:MAG: hypothetical protein ACXWWQ_08505 [Candidatus Limnocylindria bacterium]